ncbi:MAG: DUF2953 domain-containing protein [Euryarchaeota archaeon]|uniref:DUF2953 domain-containing protein n=1 Tax=Methanobacterium sp. MZD130B TaxID=3394378 RepID=UPI0009D1C464|nr:DUF2953 domain-containing protein [Euryarchaeota archaeon]OPZ92197.1 MAG: hypothetical protein BWY74_01700 [Firmicutes bacterium ADurb.Bin419]HHT18673.1 DUF2953 domain-containing protein [Methanobacterium sp.]
MIYVIIGIIIIILVLILLSFLAIPLNLSLALKKSGSDINGKFSLRWLGIKIFYREIPGEEKEETEKKKKKDEEDKFDLDRILKILKLFLEAWPHIYQLMLTIYRSFIIEKIFLDLTMGLESPADTALFTGYIWAFTYPLNALTRINTIITPDFDRRILDGNLELDVKLKLGGVVIEAIRAYTKKPVRELIHELRG